MQGKIREVQCVFDVLGFRGAGVDAIVPAGGPVVHSADGKGAGLLYDLRTGAGQDDQGEED